MRKSLGKAGRVRVVAMAAVLLLATSPARSHAPDSIQDFVMSPAPGAAPLQRSPAVSKFRFMFGAPARWQGTLHWSYNHANAPAQFSNSKDAVIAQIIAESTKWTSVCGIQIAYDGETTVAPHTLAAGPNGVSVEPFVYVESGGPDINAPSMFECARPIACPHS